MTPPVWAETICDLPVAIARHYRAMGRLRRQAPLRRPKVSTVAGSNDTDPTAPEIQRIQDAYVTPRGGFFDGTLSPVLSYDPDRLSDDPWWVAWSGFTPPTEQSPRIERAVYCGSFWGDNYYHWLIEAACRVAVAEDHIRANRLPVVTTSGAHAYQTASLSFLFPDLEFLPVQSHGMRIDRCEFMPFDPHQPDRVAEAARRLRELSRQRLPQSPKLIRRALWIDRTEGNRVFRPSRQGFHQKIQALGYEIVNPANLSFVDQVRIHSQARVIAGPHGAAFTNMLWAPEGCRVIEIAHATYQPSYYGSLATALGHEHQRIICQPALRYLGKLLRQGQANTMPIKLTQTEEDRLLDVLAEAAS